MYLWAILPFSSIQRRLFLSFFEFGSSLGSWTPTEMGRECFLADSWRPRTRGDLSTGLQSFWDSSGPLER